MRKKIDLKAVFTTATKLEVNQKLTFQNLVTAWLAKTQNGDDVYQLRKWQSFLTTVQPWSIIGDEIVVAADSMRPHDYKAGSVNRDFSVMYDRRPLVAAIH